MRDATTGTFAPKKRDRLGEEGGVSAKTEA
jgi:hypothetical protein